jgi:hypothetical protein
MIKTQNKQREVAVAYLSQYRSIFLEELSKTTENLKTARHRTRNRTWDFPNLKLNNYTMQSS